MQHILSGSMYGDVSLGDGKVTHVSEWIPTVEEESYSGIREIQLRTRHFTNGKLFLTGDVTDEMANNFVSEFLFLVERGEPVDIYINSPGGSSV